MSTMTTERNIAAELAASDIATLARMAADDAPGLLQMGRDWTERTHPAAPYLRPMLEMRGVTRENVHGVSWGHDDVEGIVIRFLGNAKGWRGETAAAVKAALRDIIARR
jgi:hypothetical protein